MEIVEFLTACLDEDERIARAIEDEEQQWNPGDKNLGSAVVGAEYGAAVVVGPYDYLDWSVREHIAAHDPARVLREVDAKWQVIAGYATAVQAVGDLTALRQRLQASGKATVMADAELEAAIHRRDTLLGVLRLLALPYADRPGYKEGWRP